MDPNYHYIICGEGMLYLNKDAPFKEIGLPTMVNQYDVWGKVDISVAFHTYSSLETRWTNYEANTDKFIEYVLNIGENAKYIEVFGGGFRIVRVPKELADYTSLKYHSAGCCGEDRELVVEMDRSKAIIDITKKTLEDPTHYKLTHLKERIALFENAQIEEVKTAFSYVPVEDEATPFVEISPEVAEDMIKNPYLYY
jgi:hypothetical protein